MPSWINPPEWDRTYATTSTTTGTTVYVPVVRWSTVSDTSTWTTSTAGPTWRFTAIDGGNLQAQQAAAYMNAQMLRQRAYERYPFGGPNDWQITAIGGRPIYIRSAPAMITHQEQIARDRALYARAMAEHDEQEAARLLREIERVESLALEERRAVEERAQRQREEEARRAAARLRARELLLEHLSPAQRETFEKNGWFVVQGGKSGTKYRIRAVESMIANVDVLQRHDGRTLHRLCAHVPVGQVPLGDQLLAQKIMLELAEDDFLKKANRHAA